VGISASLRTMSASRHPANKAQAASGSSRPPQRGYASTRQCDSGALYLGAPRSGAITYNGLDDVTIRGLALATLRHRKTPRVCLAITLFRSFCISAIVALCSRVSPSIARRPHGNCRRSDGPHVRIRSPG